MRPLRRPLLFHRFPRLRGRLPWLELGELPTPVEPLPRLGRELGRSQLWVKRDDRTSPAYGGNKVRKLEFVLAHARALGRRTIITVGAAGSNHVLATALHGSRQGLRTTAILVPQPSHPYVRQNLLADWAVGCRLEPVGSAPEAVARFAALYRATRRADGRAPYVLWAGGSNAHGVLGYVEGALEIAAQVEAQLLPEPAAIFVPVGSAGTLAGLVLGCRLAGLRSEPVGVRVYDRSMANAVSVATLARWALHRLRRLDPSVPDVSLSPRSIQVLHGYCGEGYAHGTDAGRAAIEQAQSLERLSLEPTYTGKAMAAFVDRVARPSFGDRPALFVDTYSSADLEALVAEAPGPEVLPAPLQRYFCGPDRQSNRRS